MVTSDYDAGANCGNLCVKGRYGWEYIHSDERLTTPLMRKEGRLTPCSWEAALQETARGLERIKGAYGADAIGVIGSGRLTNEEAYLLQKFTRAALGTNNVDTSGGFTYQGLLSLKECLGYPAMTNSIAELRDAEVILAVRSDPQETHPMVKLEVIRALSRNRAFLIAANSYETWLHARAHCAIIYRPGTEVAFLNGMMQIIFSEGLEDRAFIAERTRGCEELRRAVADFDPATVESITGVPADLLVLAARKYAGSKKSSILISSGLGLRGDEGGITRAAASLALSTGNIGRPSAGVAVLSEKSNSQGVLDMGLIPGYLPGYRDLQDQSERRTFEIAWNARLSSTPGLNALEQLSGAAEGRVKALYLAGENPLLTYPDSRRTLQALEQAELVVVQDLFLSETAAQAHVVLPALSLPEKEGTITSTERRVQQCDRALSPAGNGKSDGEIIIDLARRVGYDMRCQNPRQVLQEIASLVPFYSGIARARIPGSGIQWPCDHEHEQGTPRLYQDRFPQGRATIKPALFTRTHDPDDGSFPFFLVSVPSLFHSGCLSLRARGLTEVAPQACVELNRSDAARLQIAPGDRIIISSAHGSITVDSMISDRTPPGSVLVPHHLGRLRLHLLTDAASPITRVAVGKA
jgi:formate dehydrogenase alpha subunit